METTSETRLALLIDADNISPSLAGEIFKRVHHFNLDSTESAFVVDEAVPEVQIKELFFPIVVAVFVAFGVLWEEASIAYVDVRKTVFRAGNAREIEINGAILSLFFGWDWEDPFLAAHLDVEGVAEPLLFLKIVFGVIHRFVEGDFGSFREVDDID